MKKYFILLLLTINSLLFAKTISFQDENFIGTISYNDIAKPGDAIFAKLNLKFISKQSKKQGSSDTHAVMQLFQDEKELETSRFYFINSKNKRTTTPELLCGIPLSTWLDAEKEYSLKIFIDIGTSIKKEFSLPFTLEHYDFIAETIPLNQKNSDIKQDMSVERLAQIEKLNTILKTIMPQDVYSLKPFIKPMESNRLTSFFGDRRTFTYTDGKSSTSLHYGNDYGIPEGTPIVSCAEGRVVMAENRISTGWSIVIEHLPGLYSLYYHLKELDVKEGQMVKQGELLGKSGATGLATGPHLHWEIRLNMAAVRPEFFMQDFAHQNNNN